MNTITKDKRISVISALVEGNSIRSTVRMTGVSKGAVLRLLEWIGEACLDYQDKVFNNLKLRRIQCDEVEAAADRREEINEHERDVLTVDVAERLWCPCSLSDSCTWVCLTYNDRKPRSYNGVVINDQDDFLRMPQCG